MEQSLALTGCVVLVVEDEYYIATEAADALREAGAVILGPCPTHVAATHMLTEFRPTHAVIDLNLGGSGPQFAMMRSLKDQAVPTLIMSGYDPSVVPDDLSDTPFLQKPVAYRSMIAALRSSLGRSCCDQ